MARADGKRTVDDAGEKIGGARKDLAAARLVAADLDGMTGAEQALLIQKDRVWPKPDWAALVEGGMNITAAAQLKLMRDGIAAKPRVFYGLTFGEAARGYVETLERAATLAGACRTVDDVRALNTTLTAAMGLEGRGVPNAVKARFMSTYKGNYNPFHVDMDDRVKADRLVAEGFPGDIPAWRKGVVCRPYGQRFILVKGGKVLGGKEAFLTEIEAMEWLRLSHEAATASRGAKGGTEAQEPKRPHLDTLRREGPPRAEGAVTPESFISTFGFRAVEFGQWLPDAERQQVLEMSFDALNDLADVLEVPPEAISLDGKLAVAFGARGSGAAAAHYEPDRQVLNMTRLRGAGFVAHEWGHALDHHLGILGNEDPVEDGAPRYASGGHKHRRSRDMSLPRLPLEIATLVETISKAFRETRMTREEAGAAARASLAKTLEETVKAAGQVDQHMAAHPDKPDRKWLKSMSDWNATALKRMDVLRARIEQIDGGMETTECRTSNFLKQAQGMSNGDYWIRPNEMFARSFESAVFDKLADMGRCSEYLVHGVEEWRFDDPAFRGNPYPTGGERTALSAMVLDIASQAVPLIANVADKAHAPAP